MFYNNTTFHVKHCISNYIIIHNLSKIYRLYTYIVKKYIFSLKLLNETNGNFIYSIDDGKNILFPSKETNFEIAYVIGT